MENQKIRVLDWHALDIRLVWAYEGRPIVPSGKVGGNRQVAWLMNQGSATVFTSGRAVTATKGQWLFPPLGEIDRSFSDDARVLSISASTRWSNGRFLLELHEPQVCDNDSYPSLKSAALALLYELREFGAGEANDLLLQKLSFQSYLRCNQLLQSWVSAYVECLTQEGVEPYIMDNATERPQRVKERLDKMPISTPFLIDALSAAIGLSPRQINRLFKDAYGITPRDYWNQRRLQAAIMGLNEECKSVKTVAYECGFASPALFSRWFSGQTGTSPTKFRLSRENPQTSLTMPSHLPIEAPAQQFIGL